MEKHILFLDLDGTLLDDRKQITAGNREALRRVLDKGHSVVITTGRPLKSAMEQAASLELDRPGCFLIAYNGAVVYDWTQRAQIICRTLPAEAVGRIFDCANGLGVHVQTYDTWNVLVEGRCEDDALRTYCSRTRMPWKVIGSVHEDLKEAPVKVLLIDFQGREKMEAVAGWVRQHLQGTVECIYSCGEYLEIVPSGVSKGAAVELLCEKLRLPLSCAIAVGDAANDLSMIRSAGIGVAVANAAGEVKAAADYVTAADNNHDAVAEVADRYL